MRFEAQLIQGIWRVVVFDDLGERVICQAINERCARETALMLSYMRAA